MQPTSRALGGMQCRVDLKMLIMSLCTGPRCLSASANRLAQKFIYVREEHLQYRKLDSRGEPAIYCGRSTMDALASGRMSNTVSPLSINLKPGASFAVEHLLPNVSQALDRTTLTGGARYLHNIA